MNVEKIYTDIDIIMDTMAEFIRFADRTGLYDVAEKMKVDRDACREVAAQCKYSIDFYPDEHDVFEKRAKIAEAYCKNIFAPNALGFLVYIMQNTIESNWRYGITYAYTRKWFDALDRYVTGFENWV